MGYRIAHTLTGSIVSAVILWKGAGEVLGGSFTVGMLVAYLSYQGRFSASINSLTDKFFAWRMLDVYNERLADIVLEQVEGHQLCGNMPASPICYALPLSLNGIQFSHRGANASIIHDLSLTLNPGEIVAITGKSGCVKSTLVKLILGIHMPDTGTIRAFNILHSHPDYFQARQRIGTVLQDDHLFRGSVADNIISSTKHAIRNAWQTAQGLL